MLCHGHRGPDGVVNRLQRESVLVARVPSNHVEGLADARCLLFQRSFRLLGQFRMTRGHSSVAGRAVETRWVSGQCSLVDKRDCQYSTERH